MCKKIAVIGGDMRMVYLADMLAKKYNVLTYGQELANIKTDAMKIDNLKNAIELSDIIIGPIPFTKDGESVQAGFSKEKIVIKEVAEQCKEKTLIAGAISDEVCSYVSENGGKTIDLMKNESLTVLNTIATAEGTIEIAMSKTKRILQGSKVLVLGYGRVAKVVAQKFAALGAKVTCAARRPEALAWIEVDGYEKINIIELGDNTDKTDRNKRVKERDLESFDIVINTPPTMILNRDRLLKLKKDCLVIDLASYPGGVDREAIKELDINFEWALGLPGKVAPITAAEHIYSAIKEVIA